MNRRQPDIYWVDKQNEKKKIRVGIAHAQNKDTHTPTPHEREERNIDSEDSNNTGRTKKEVKVTVLSYINNKQKKRSVALRT